MEKFPSLEEVQKIFAEYKREIFQEIEKETKIKFKIKEIKFEKWNKDYWSCGINRILIGNYHKPKSKILTSVIHEAIHINTLYLNLNYKENSIAVEISTCVSATRIIKRLNKKFKKKFKMNKFDEHYQKYEKREKEFEKLKDNKGFYEFFELIKNEIK